MSDNNIIFKYGKVIDISDNLDGGRIRVFIRGEDPDDYQTTDIPYAFPLLPKTLHTKPNVGENVLVTTINGDFSKDRLWIGPIISQLNKIDDDSISGLGFLSGGLVLPSQAASTDPDNVGVNPDDDDVALIGRGTTDVIAKPNEVRIRAGKTVDMVKLNKKNPAYTQVKYDSATDESVVNIVANNINILSHKSIDNFNLADANKLIDDTELKKIYEKAHLLPFGDILIEFMDIFIKAFITHVHAYNGMSPDLKQKELEDLMKYDKSKILSKNVRIN